MIISSRGCTQGHTEATQSSRDHLCEAHSVRPARMGQGQRGSHPPGLRNDFDCGEEAIPGLQRRADSWLIKRERAQRFMYSCMR